MPQLNTTQSERSQREKERALKWDTYLTLLDQDCPWLLPPDVATLVTSEDRGAMIEAMRRAAKGAC